MTEISNTWDHNTFQSCFPLHLTVLVPDLEKRIPEYSQSLATHYFKCALLRQFRFIIDVEAIDLQLLLIKFRPSFRSFVPTKLL